MQMVDYKEMGNRIRLARKNLKLTQEDASERCDITASFYGNVERGDKVMSVETLMKVSKGLNVSADYILFGEDGYGEDTMLEFIEVLRRNTDVRQFEKYVEIIRAISGVIHKL